MTAAMLMTAPPPPATTQLLALIDRQIAATGLDLSGLNVVTEAATGAYATTAVVAARAGARIVHALARNTQSHGSAADAAREVLSLAAEAGVADRIRVVDGIAPGVLAQCDILTNSGHLRPITAETIRLLPPRAAIGLMFEDWEFRDTDLDLAACRARGVKVAAVNERHPAVGVFPFLGPLCVLLLEEAGVDVASAEVALLCDNPFSPFIEAGLDKAGAQVRVFTDPLQVPDAGWTVVVVALTPGASNRLDVADFAHLSRHAPRALIAQFWGDIDRDAAHQQGFAVWPPSPPRRGHMAILLNALGPEPIVRLQTGGLRAAELAFRGERSVGQDILQLM
jgi:hypothetical protein